MNLVGSFLTEILPPCFSIVVLVLARPRPVPFFLVVYSGSKIFFMLDFGIPGPESENIISICFEFSFAEIAIVPSFIA